jgi:hypothetical protein
VDLLPESALRDADLLVRLVVAARAVIIFASAAWAFVGFLHAGVRTRRAGVGGSSWRSG